MMLTNRYCTAEKVKARKFINDAVDHHIGTPSRILTLPSKTAKCAEEYRARWGDGPEIIGIDRDENLVRAFNSHHDIDMYRGDIFDVGQQKFGKRVRHRNNHIHMSYNTHTVSGPFDLMYIDLTSMMGRADIDALRNLMSHSSDRAVLGLTFVRNDDYSEADEDAYLSSIVPWTMHVHRYHNLDSNMLVAVYTK